MENPWDTVFQNTDYGDYRLPTGTKIGEVYKDLNGALLILGDPGSGKTTTLIELCRDMIEVAENDDAEPIPVIFNLSSWADERKPLAGWLQDELVTKYQVPLKVAQDWLEANALLLLLDGLDEVDSRYRDDCVNAINAFRSEYGFTRLVVCSRIADYEALTNRLNLNGAIVLQPLDDTQVDHYLATLGADMQGVRTAMSADSSLRKLGDSPLMLSIMTIAFRGLTAADLPQLDTVEAQRKRLFESYTNRMFERRKSNWYSPEKTLHYLKWLAGRMVERKQSVFYIENLQVDWIADERRRRLYRIVGRTSFGVLAGAVVGALAGLATLLLAFLGSFTIRYSTPGNVLAGALLFILVPAAIGGLIFGTAGIQAYALDTLPDSFQSLSHFIWRFANVVIAGTLFGLIATVLTLLTFAIIALLTNTMHLSESVFYRAGNNQSVTGLAALLLYGVVFFAIGGGLGAFTGAVTAYIAAVVNIVQPRRQLLLGVMISGLLGLIITLSVIAICLASLRLLYTVQNDVYYSTTSLPALILAGAIASVLLAIAVRFIPARFKAAPYILLLAGLSVYGAMALTLSSPMQLTTETGVVGIILTLICAVAGLVIARITDKVESAEALRWRWSWRWSLLGLAGMVALGLFQSLSVLSYATSYTRTQEASYTQQYIKPAQEIVNILQPQLDQFRTQWESYRSQYADFDGISTLITRKVILDSKIRFHDGHKTDPQAPTWDDLDQYTNYAWYGHFTQKYELYTQAPQPSFAWQTGSSYPWPIGPNEYPDVQKQLQEVDQKLAGYKLTDAQIQKLSDTQYAILRRDDLITLT